MGLEQRSGQLLFTHPPSRSVQTHTASTSVTQLIISPGNIKEVVRKLQKVKNELLFATVHTIIPTLRVDFFPLAPHTPGDKERIS